MTASSRPIALTIAGSDSSGGAGIQADIKTFSALGVYGASVITAVTAQNTRGVSAVHAVPVAVVEAQIEAVLSDLAVGAIKTGMLANAAIVACVADALRQRPEIALVVDPVMVSTSGNRLLESDAIEIMRSRLFPRASVITPNLPEAAALLDEAPAATLEEMERQATMLLRFGSRVVVVKGGHAKPGDVATDVLVSADGLRECLSRPWVDTPNTHGTGCTLSAAIAAHLAAGFEISSAVEMAKDYLSAALAAGRTLMVGQGSGPVDHLLDRAPPHATSSSEFSA